MLYSDGLVERDDRTLGLAELAPELAGTEAAAEVLGRLLGRVPDRPDDDVTVVVLRRTPSPGRLAGVPSTHLAAASPATTGNS
jgi:hypothetical protein